MSNTYVRLKPVAPRGAAHFGFLKGYDDDWKLVEGVSVADEFPGDAAYRMNKDLPNDMGLEDAVHNLNSQLVVSERLRAFLESRGDLKIEFLPVRLINHKGREVREPYAIANILRHVDAVDKEATIHEWNSLDDTAMIGIKNLTVNPASVPDDALLFRLVHVTDVIGVRSDLAEALREAGFTGLDFPDFSAYKG